MCRVVSSQNFNFLKNNHQEKFVRFWRSWIAGFLWYKNRKKTMQKTFCQFSQRIFNISKHGVYPIFYIVRAMCCSIFMANKNLEVSELTRTSNYLQFRTSGKFHRLLNLYLELFQQAICRFLRPSTRAFQRYKFCWK